MSEIIVGGQRVAVPTLIVAGGVPHFVRLRPLGQILTEDPDAEFPHDHSEDYSDDHS